MRTIHLKLIVALALIIPLGAPSCWAAEKGYCYVVSSSMREKVVFFTPVFSAKVSGAIYSQEEFVADVELIRDIEDQFQQYLKNLGLNSMDFVTEARVGYRSQAIAEKRLAAEKSEFEGRGYTIKKTGSFAYAD